MQCDFCNRDRPKELLDFFFMPRNGHHDGRLGKYAQCTGGNCEKDNSQLRRHIGLDLAHYAYTQDREKAQGAAYNNTD